MITNQQLCSSCRRNIALDEAIEFHPLDTVPHYFHRACISEWLMQGNFHCPLCPNRLRIISSQDRRLARQIGLLIVPYALFSFCVFYAAIETFTPSYSYENDVKLGKHVKVALAGFFTVNVILPLIFIRKSLL